MGKGPATTQAEEAIVEIYYHTKIGGDIAD
jgi:hypothetical protein